jgi:glutaredoxin
MANLVVKVYRQEGCSLCKKASKVIDRVNEEMPFELKEVDISLSEDLVRRYGDNIPMVFINGTKAFKYKVDEGEFRKKVRKEFIRAGLSKINSKTTHYT